jgi:hypothetical protein
VGSQHLEERRVLRSLGWSASRAALHHSLHHAR